MNSPKSHLPDSGANVGANAEAFGSLASASIRLRAWRQWLGAWAVACAALILPAMASAATFLVDDSKSIVLDANVPLQWRSLSPSSGDHTVHGVTRVQVRLDVTPWIGKFGRIYMALPAQPNGVVTAHWQSQGQLLSGQLKSGQRGLVWSGVVPQPQLDDVMTVTIQSDGRLLSTAQTLRFSFEIDLP